MHTAFQFENYTVKRQVLALTGKLRVYNPTGDLLMYVEQRLFKLKEDIRAYTDETKSQELLYIQARNILDFSAAYDVIDSSSQLKVGVLRRRGLRSMLRDQWEILDNSDQPIGILQEDNLQLALLRRFLLGALLPQNYDILIGEQRAADLRQRFNPFRYTLDLEFIQGVLPSLDHRLGIAAAILLGVIEGRQE